MHLPHKLLSYGMMRRLAKHHPVKALIGLFVVLFLMLFGLVNPVAMAVWQTNLTEITAWIGIVVVPTWTTQLGLITYFHFGPGRRELYDDN
ncbi:hypothetical protein [Cupriavidus sp. D39]|uniref:hypothetical protein n=1 Tax=Cupriavidus sp. D39 TaxID=2997877 RepID=UPI002270302E|nr:hypothetical protein [Cupriavidus sp. D39]MCY0852523.1 hypothetical protein [Cupriavidus sp. D39]